jgi:hypothetical protein
MATQVNYQETTDLLADEMLRLLTNSLEVAPLFNTDWQENLEKSFPVGATFRVPLPNLGTVRRNTLAYTPTSIQDRHVDVSCDRIAGWDAEWDNIERILYMPRSEAKLKAKILKPAVAQLKQEIDSQAAQFAFLNTPNFVGILGTNPSTFDSVYGAADERLTRLAGNYGDKTMILDPAVARALRAATTNTFNPTPDNEIARMFKTGYIGKVTGFGDTYQSMSLYSHTSGVWAGTVEVTSAVTADASTLTLTCTSGDTFVAGDIFDIAAVYDLNPMTLRSTGTLKQFVVTQSVTASSTSQTISIYPGIVLTGPYQNVDAAPAAGADLTMFRGTAAPTSAHSGVQSLALGRDAFLMVGIKLENPKASSVEMISESTDPDTGLSLSYLRMIDPVSRKMINRFDMAFGFARGHADHCAVRVLGA